MRVFLIRMIWTLLTLLAGLVLLWKGADFLADGAVALAERMGVSQLIIGLTVVAMGTSAPEVAAGIVAALGHRGDIVLGDVYGANIADLSLIGGIVALIRPLGVRAPTLKREIPAMFLALFVLGLVLRGAKLSRVDGAILMAVFMLFLLYTIWSARGSAAREPITELNVVIDRPRTARWNVVLVLLGIAGLAGGAQLAVHSAERIGHALGLSDAVIGSTILAIGTTLPELMTATVAAVKGHQDISVGNLIGSVIFNTLVVTGIASLARPLVVSARFAGGPDYWIMLGIGLGFTAAALLGRQTISRLGGVALLTAYGSYVLYLLHSTGVI
jgi:cation:H+ antiporter